MSLVDARWVGPGGMVLVDGTQLVPGVTVVQISEGEAAASDNWQIVESTSNLPTPKAKATDTDEGGA